MNKKHLFSLSLTLIIVMLFSALGPTTVYADDGAPADTTTGEAPQTDGEPVDEGDTEQADEIGGDEGAVEEAADDAIEGEADEVAPDAEATDETVEGEADEVAPDAEVTEEIVEGVAEEATPGTEAADETGEGETVAEEPSLMEQVPDNTEIVVINSEGEIEPLATEEAAAIIVAGDPMWCPDNVAPGGAGCSNPGVGNVNYDPTSLESLLTYLAANQPDGPGTIWIEDSYDSSINDAAAAGFTLDSTTFNTMKDYNLTIQGGWDGASGSTTITGTSSFDVPIVIGSETNPWGGSLTIRNIIISGVVNDVGLTVYTGDSVTVEDSEFTNNDGAGVFIDADKDVTVRRSKINDNGSNNWNVVDGKGLEIKSGGFVTLSDVEANDNQIFGADIEAANAVTIGNSFFNGNLMYTPDLTFYGYGLTVVSQGNISLSNVEADENYLWGASLDGPNVFIEDSTFNENVSDRTDFIDDTGLLVVSPGDVFLLNVEANDNRLIGADIDAGGDVTITDSSFSRNFGTTVDDTGAETHWGYGLQVVSGGAITLGSGDKLLGVVVDENYLFGANLVALNDDVNIEGSSFSRNATPVIQANSQGGLMIQSGGFVTLDTVTVNDNLMFGADIVADGFIDIENSVFNNNLNGFGLSAISNTTEGMFITLTNVTALGNGEDGAYLETNNGFVCITDGSYTNNGQYNAQIINSTYDVTPIIDNIFTSGSTSGDCSGGGGNGTGGGGNGGGGGGGTSEVTYDDNDASWTYTGNWAIWTGDGPYNGSFHYSSTVNSYATFTFEGTMFSLIYASRPTRGEMDIFIDGNFVATVNAYNLNELWQQEWSPSTPLLAGTHTVQIVHKSGTFIDIDGIRIFQ